MSAMRTVKYTFWRDEEFFIGFLNDFPDYQTQGYSKAELVENLKDLLSDIESGEVPFIRKVEEMAIAS
jgi:predicted RNase H-like HicB family nuclease